MTKINNKINAKNQKVSSLKQDFDKSFKRWKSYFGTPTFTLVLAKV